MNRRVLTFLGGLGGLLVLIVVAVGLFLARTESGSAVIDLAGRQRMLSQRISAVPVFEAMESGGREVEPAEHDAHWARVFRESMGEFEETQRVLIQGDAAMGIPPCPSDETRIQLEAVGAVWDRLRSLAEQHHDPANVRELADYSSAMFAAGERLLVETDLAAKLLQDHYVGEARLQHELQVAFAFATLAAGALLIFTFYQMRAHRRRLDAQLRASHATTRAILDGAADGIVTISERGIVESFNRAAEAIFGWNAHEVVGKSINMLIPPPQCDEHDGYLRRYLATGEKRIVGIRRELVGLRRGGATFPMDLHVSEVKLGDQRLFTGIICDISERERTEQRIRDIARVPEENPDPILRVACDGTILYRNPAARERLKDWNCRVGGVLPEGMRAAISQALDTDSTVDFEAECGNRKLSWMCAPQAAAGYANLYGRDISEQKIAEQRIKDYAGALESTNLALSRVSAEAEAANEAKSEFLANMSHEIRTPMTAILGFADSLLTGHLSEAEATDATVTIRRNGQHLLEIINDILDISKIDAGKMRVERIACSPLQIVRDVHALMRARAEDKGLPFSVEYAAALPKTIVSDPTRVRQILINLVGNAIKFTKTGGIRLVTRWVPSEHVGCPNRLTQSFDGKESGEYAAAPISQMSESCLQFEVIDSGIGLNEEQVGRVFQAFSQADSSTTRRYGGTGLGLAVSQRLALLLGGSMDVTSEVGVGSTFRVTIPTGPLDGVEIIQQPGQSTQPDEPQAVPSATEARLECRILLAEDGPDNQRLISLFLKKAGADVTVAENGKLALEAALTAGDQGNPFAAILMDMQMPVMDGYEATEQLREAGYAGPIIALTAHAMTGDREKCLRAGCNEYVAKPVERRKLIETIRTQLVQSETVTP